MSPKHQEFLERNALRAAQREISRNPRVPISRDTFLSTRIQILEPLKRILLFLVGIVLGGTAFWLQREVGNPALTVFFAVLAVTCGLIALFGFRKTVNDALGACAEFVFNRLIDAVK